MQFSERTSWDEDDTGYATELSLARRSRPLVDLTLSNPTQCGFERDAASLLAPLTDPEALLYAPQPFGLYAAREAVATYYLDHQATVKPEHVCLTTSTSEAYSFLFQLLCDPGDELLIARPSYPLFDILARLHDLRLREYPSFYDPAHVAGQSHSPIEVGSPPSAWSFQLEELSSRVTNRTRALVVVHPNNPTGNFVSPAERATLEAFCAERELALIVDEVFLDYTLPGRRSHTFAGGGECRALCLVLSGLSKVCALPQMKLSWIVANGPSALVERALERLEVIADTYLSLNAPVQQALRPWLAAREPIQRQIRERMASNLAALQQRLNGTSASVLDFDAGWTVVLRVPRHFEGVEFGSACLARDLVVQPGSLYGLPPGRVVLSLLTPPDIWHEGLRRLPIDFTP